MGQGYNYNVAPTQYLHTASAAPVVQQAHYVQPAPVAVAPVVQAAAVDTTGSQYHAQDDFGQYSFGYNDPNSVRQEVKTADGVVRGAYRYVDTSGVVQTVEYIADAAGFRVAGTNLPQGTVALPASVVDTPEVAAAKQAHALAHAQADAAAAVQPEDLSLYDTPVAAPVAVPAPVVFAQEPIAPVAAESAQQVHYVAAPVAAPVVAAAPVVHAAAPEGSQYHSQDDIGQYSYGYSDPNSVKQEIKTADGVTRGAYSYVDANGIVQTVNYIADALGFRVGATNLPVHIVDQPAAAAAPVAAPAAAPLPVVQSAYTAAAAAPVVAPQVSYAYLPYATNYGYNLPATHTVAAAPAVVEAAAPAVVAAPTSVDGANSQFHAQDDLGQYNYGFAHPTQTKQEVKTADGVTRGGYSYIDANGIVQTVNYISDAMGFRVAATNLPVHNVDAAPAAPVPAAPVAPAAAPAVSAYHAGDVIAPQVQYSYLPYAQNYAYHTPATAVVKAAPSRPVVSVTHSAPAHVVHSAPVVQAAAPVTYAA